MIKEKFTKAIEKYTGRKVTELKTYHDPKVRGTYALRATMKGKGPKTLDFLIVTSHMDTVFSEATLQDVADALEDTQWKTWPPKSGAPKFFW